jgi:hypothetical protein
MVLMMAVLAVALALLVLIGCWWCGRGNLGLPFGYYGQFNRVKSELKRVPGVRIVSTHLHKDLSLEDFGIVVQIKSGLRLRLQFSEDRESFELFKRADGLLVSKSTFWGRGLVYSLGPDGRLEAATGQEIRNAVDVLENFDKIAEVIKTDHREGVAETEWTNAPRSCLCIYYPIPF